MGRSQPCTRGAPTGRRFYAKEPDLAAAFAKRYPACQTRGSEQEILDDSTIQLVVSAAIPDERAAFGIEAMRHGKDVLLGQARRRPRSTSSPSPAACSRRRGGIFSILYSERLENRATVKAGELVRRARSATSSRPSDSVRTG